MKGIYSFLLVTVFIFCAVLLMAQGNNIRESLLEGAQTAMEIERASFIRFQIEENTDSIVTETIEREIQFGNRSGNTVNQKILMELEKYFGALEKENGLGVEIEFYNIPTNQLSKNFTPTTKPQERSLELNEKSETLVVSVKEHIYLTTFQFTGGLMRNNAVLGVISCGESEQYFLLLPGYTVIKEVVTA